MARIAGVDLPANKKVVISLTYIYGIGISQSTNILNKVNTSGVRINNTAKNIIVLTAFLFTYFFLLEYLSI